jgi:hypothetical protein
VPESETPVEAVGVAVGPPGVEVVAGVIDGVTDDRPVVDGIGVEVASGVGLICWVEVGAAVILGPPEPPPEQAAASIAQVAKVVIVRLLKSKARRSEWPTEYLSICRLHLARLQMRK